jgi:hypothetical protein
MEALLLKIKTSFGEIGFCGKCENERSFLDKTDRKYIMTI